MGFIRWGMLGNKSSLSPFAPETGIAGLYLDAEDGKHDFYHNRGFVGIQEPNPLTNILPMFISVDTIKEAKQ